MIHWPAPVARGPVRGLVVVPGSKSASARSLLLAALADGASTLTGVLDSRDTALMRAGLTMLGAAFTDLPDGRLGVRAGGDAARRRHDRLWPGRHRDAVPSPPRSPRHAGHRPSSVTMLPAHARRLPCWPRSRALGADVSEPLRLPFTVSGTRAVRGGCVTVDASASSQFVSALLLAGARYPDGLEVTHSGATLPSLPHIEMTVTLLARRGVRVDRPGPVHLAGCPRPDRGARRDRRARPDQRSHPAGRGPGHRRRAQHGLAGGLRAGRRRTAGRAGGVRRARQPLLAGRRPRRHRLRDRRSPGRRHRPARRQRADPRCGGPGGGRRRAERDPRGRAHPRPRDRPPRSARHRADRARRRGHRDRRRAGDHPGAPGTAARSTPTPTTGSPTPAPCSAW